LEFADLSPSDVFESVIKTNPNLAYSLAILDALVAKGAEARAEAEKPWIVRGQANMEPISAPKPNDGDDSAAKKIASDQLKVQEWLSSERISLIQDEYAQRIAEIEREADRQREAAHGSVALLDQIGQIEAQKIAEVEADKLKARQEAQNEYRRLLMTENQREVADLQERHEEELRIAEEYGLDLHVLRVKQEMELTDLLAKQEDERLRNSRDALDGMTVAFRDYADEATNLAHQTGEVITSVMGGLEDQLVNFVQTGKMQFEDLANSIISDLLRIAIRANITGPIASMLGGLDFFNAHGNVYGESGVMAFAHGGAFTNSIVTKPTLFPFAKGTGLMGEAGPEAIMPLTRTSGGDLGVRAEGFGGAGVVVNIINNANGTEVSTRESTGANGGKTIEVLIDEINGKNAARHGSATDRAMRGAYGVKPALVRR
jgi:lambda family phage tail tape measure protein